MVALAAVFGSVIDGAEREIPAVAMGAGFLVAGVGLAVLRARFLVWTRQQRLRDARQRAMGWGSALAVPLVAAAMAAGWWGLASAVLAAVCWMVR